MSGYGLRQQERSNTHLRGAEQSQARSRQHGAGAAAAMFKSLSLKKEPKDPKDGKDAKAAGGAKLGGRVGSFRKSRKGATVTALESTGAAKAPAPPTAVRDDGAGEKLMSSGSALSGAPGGENPRHRPTRSISMTSGGAVIPVGWPVGESTLQVSIPDSASGAGVDTKPAADAGGETVPGLEPPTESDTAPLVSPAPSSSAAPTPGPASARNLASPASATASHVSFAGLDALEAEIQARERELSESKARHEEAESAIKAMEGKWKAEVEAARAQLAVVSKAKEELESQLAAKEQEILLLEATQPTGQSGKRSKGGALAAIPELGDTVKVEAPGVDGPEAAEEEGGEAGGVQGGSEGEGEYDRVASPDSAAVLELIQASKSETSPQGKQLVGLRLENVVLKEKLADLERDNALLKSRVEELEKGQGLGPEEAEGTGEPVEGKDSELAEKLAAAEARLAELERGNASLLAEVASLKAGGVPGVMGLKPASLYDLFCAS